VSRWPVSRAAFHAWLLSRAAVLLLVAAATYLQVRHGWGRSPIYRGWSGFFAWDGGWYRAIARHGYGGLHPEALRFFPLVPLLATPFRPFAGLGLLVVVNVSALAYAEGMVRLTRAELRDDAAAARAAWLALLNPVAFVLVLGYAEATAAALAVWCCLALRRRAWLAAAGLAFLGGLARPIGLLLAVPALVEALRGWRTARDRFPRVLAVVAAPAGCLAYLLWCAARFGDALAPFHAQQRSDLRGGVLASPLPGLARAYHAAVRGGPLPVSLRLVWVPLVLLLLGAAARRLPASLSLYALAIVFLAVATPRLASFERYSLSAFPLLVTAAGTRSRGARVTLGVLCGVGLAGYSILAVSHQYVP
jgi:hypothetical protein